MVPPDRNFLIILRRVSERVRLQTIDQHRYFLGNRTENQ